MIAVAVRPGGASTASVMPFPDPTPGEDEVLVRCLYMGIDGTDREINSGAYGAAPPGGDLLILGHEAVGIVVDRGASVRGFERGDLVVPTVRRPCRHEWCTPCRQGSSDMCITGDYIERGIHGAHGFLAEFFVEREEWLIGVRGELTREAVFLEPISIAEKALRRSTGLRQGVPGSPRRALVLGAGTLGILQAAILRLGSLETYVFDRASGDSPKAAAVRVTGTEYIEAGQTNLTQLAREAGPFDLIFEATGYTPLAFQSVDALAPNGVLCLLGVSGGSREISLDANKFNQQLVLGNRIVFGSVNSALQDFRVGLEHLNEIRTRWPKLLEALVTRRCRLEDVADALASRPGDIKVVVDVSA